MDPNELERLTGRALKRLPAPRAPHTLLMRVMRAVEQVDARPWYARPWLAWPLGWQCVSALVALAVVTGASLGVGAVLQMWAPDLLPGAQAAWTTVARVIEPLVSLTRSGAALWRTLVEPLAYVALIPVLTMFVVTVTFGAALSRLAFGGPSQL